MKITNKFNLPKTILNLVSHDTYSKGNAHVSVTRLIDAPQAAILRELHAHEVEVDASDLVWMFMGKTLHKILEYGGDEEHLPEERLFYSVSGWTVSGQIDVQHVALNKVRLIDYKLTRAWAVKAEKQEWVNQLNTYAWLVRKVRGYSVEGLQICAFVRDWSKYEADRNEEYPQAAIWPVEVPVWDDAAQDYYVQQRLELHQRAHVAEMGGDPLPECSDEERWARPGKWAVYSTKGAGKKATAVYDSEAAAIAHVGNRIDMYIKARPAEYIRCKSYCQAAPWCDQLRRENKNG